MGLTTQCFPPTRGPRTRLFTTGAQTSPRLLMGSGEHPIGWVHCFSDLHSESNTANIFDVVYEAGFHALPACLKTLRFSSPPSFFTALGHLFICFHSIHFGPSEGALFHSLPCPPLGIASERLRSGPGGDCDVCGALFDFFRRRFYCQQCLRRPQGPNKPGHSHAQVLKDLDRPSLKSKQGQNITPQFTELFGSKLISFLLIFSKF